MPRRAPQPPTPKKKPKPAPPAGSSPNNPFAQPTWNPATGKPTEHDAVSQAVAQANAEKAQPDKSLVRHRVIITRQTLLRSIGLYKGEIDGLWGAQSQAAWSTYVYRRRHGQSFAPYASPTQLDRNARQQAGAAALADARRAAGQAISGARHGLNPQTEQRHQAVVQAKLAQQNARQALVVQQRGIEQDAARLRANPQDAANFTFHRLSVILANRHVKWDEPTAATVVQTWLRSHGHPVAATGKWDAQTNAALLTAQHEEQHREQAAAEKAVTDHFYTRGQLVAGMKAPAWWPLADKTVPDAKGLLATLQQGGFLGDVLLRQLILHSDLPDNAWRAWQHDQLQRTVNQMLGPFSRQGDPFKLPGSKTDAIDLSTAINATPLDLHSKLRLTEQGKVLLTSTSYDEFTRRLSAHLRLADNMYVEQMAAKAKHKSWWGNAIHLLTAPGEFARTAAVADVYMGADLLTTGHVDLTRQYWEGGNDAIEHANPILRFGYIMLADPLVYVRPFRLTSTLIRYGTRGTIYAGLGARFGAYDLIALRKSANVWGYVGKSEWSANQAVKYDGAIWHKPFAAGASKIAHNTPILRAMIAGKEKVVDAANTAVITHASHLFSTDVAQMSRFKEVATFPIRAATRGLVDRVYEQLAPRLSEQLGPVYEELKNTRTSLYGNASHTARSSVGEALVARYLEDARAQEAFRMANESQRDVVERAMSGGFNSEEYQAALTRHGGDIEAALADLAPNAEPLTRAGAAELGRREYQRVLDGVGVFLTGGADPELATELKRRMAKHSDLIGRIIVPTLQRMLLEDAKAAGVDLFDEAGIAVSARGEVANGVKALGRDAFDESNFVTRPNPLNGVDLKFEDAIHHIEDETRVKQGRLHGWFERQAAIGSPIPDNVQARMLAEARESVKSNYVFGDGTAHVIVNQDGVNGILDELGLKRGLRVRFERRTEQPERPGIQYPEPETLLGYYDPLTQEAVVRLDPNILDEFVRSGRADLAVATERESSITLAHEIRHAFQNIVENTTFGGELDVTRSLRSFEVDASAFADAWAKRGDASLVRIVQPRPGYVTDTRETLQVPDLYGRINPAFRQAPDAGRAASGAPGLGFLADNPLAAIPGRSKMDESIGRLAWNLGGKHDDTFYGVVKQGLAETKNGSVPADLHTGSHDPGSRRFDGQQSDRQRLANADFRKWAFGMHIALARAEDEAIPHSLAQSRAWFAALSKATSTQGRVAYKIANGGLQAWIFATLPLRLGWVVRNVTDNTLKTLIAGARDPRAYVSHWIPGAEGVARTVFEAGVGQVYEVAKFADKLFGTEVAEGYKAAMDLFWHHTTETLHQVFEMHGWEVPEEVLDGARFRVFDQQLGGRPMLNQSLKLDRLETLFADDPELLKVAKQMSKSDPSWLASKYKAFRDGSWHVMANLPENYYKKVIYNDMMAKLTAEGLDPIAAHTLAWSKVEATLFDYSKVTVIEDNLRLFFPFIQFWRKNTAFWAKTAVSEPWVAASFLLYQQERDKAHADWPGWMKRYVNMQEVADAASVVPGLQFVVDHGGLDNAQFDPLSFVSFNSYYRAWKDRNENLAPEDGGPGGALGFLRVLLDGMDQFSGGLALNPFVRKPLESIGIASPRAWQGMFPQTSLVRAFTHKYLGDTAAGADVERALELLDGNIHSDQIADNFNFYVQREMAGQLARGETPDRARAEATVKTWFLTQNLWGYFGGVYFRKNTPEDFYLSKLTDDAVHGTLADDNLSEKDRQALTVWTQAKKLMGDPLAFDRYIEALPYIASYYKLDNEAREQLKQDHPEIIGYVNEGVGHTAMTGKFLKNAGMYLKGAEFFAADDLARQADLPYETRQAIATYLITPELQNFWDTHGSDKNTRKKMAKAAMYGYLLDLQKTYFAIPETDFNARDSFLDEHPELGTFWQKNDDAADDYKAVMNTANAALRDIYFHVVETHGGKQGGFAAAQPFLHDHPFIFEGTSSAGKVDANGNWRVTTAKGRSYVAAKRGLDHFFKLLNAEGGKAAAYAWLNSDVPDAKLARDYFDKYGKKSARGQAYRASKTALERYFAIKKAKGDAAASKWLSSGDPLAKQAQWYFDNWSKLGSHHAADYLAAKPFLQLYFKMPAADRAAWLKGKSRGATVLRAYFKKWGDKQGMSQQAVDYVAAKPALDYYFSLSASKRNEWLHGHDPRAATVLAYFKKYGHANRIARAWTAAADKLGLITDPELRRRADFWTRYFQLTPDQRPAFIHDHAESYGVFVFGALHEGQANDAELKFIRAAMAAKLTISGKPYHLSEKEATYLYAKPLLDVFATLDAQSKQLFIAANPEIAEYLDQFSRKSLTGNAHLDKLVEDYFALPQGSQLRSDFLHANPAVQEYFDKHSTPAERAMRNVLNVYFSLAPGHNRDVYMERHPEIQVYFDRKKREGDTLKLATDAFELADPTLQPYFKAADADLAPSAERMRAALRRAHFNRFTPDDLQVRRDRNPDESKTRTAT